MVFCRGVPLLLLKREKKFFRVERIEDEMVISQALGSRLSHHARGAAPGAAPASAFGCIACSLYAVLRAMCAGWLARGVAGGDWCGVVLLWCVMGGAWCWLVHGG